MDSEEGRCGRGHLHPADVGWPCPAQKRPRHHVTCWNGDRRLRAECFFPAVGG